MQVGEFVETLNQKIRDKFFQNKDEYLNQKVYLNYLDRLND